MASQQIASHHARHTHTHSEQLHAFGISEAASASPQQDAGRILNGDAGSLADWREVLLGGRGPRAKCDKHRGAHRSPGHAPPHQDDAGSIVAEMPDAWLIGGRFLLGAAAPAKIVTVTVTRRGHANAPPQQDAGRIVREMPGVWLIGRRSLLGAEAPAKIVTVTLMRPIHGNL